MVDVDRSSERSVRIAVIGDVHDYWDTEADVRALQYLKPDLVLFVGDFGNENVEVVEGVSQVPFPKVVILGNHDAWHTVHAQRAARQRAHAVGGLDGVQRQLDLLGECHVGFSRRDFPALQLSVVGSRPFSWGGSTWRHATSLCAARFGVRSFEESAERIVAAAMGAPEDHALIFLGHNGPLGLGAQPHDICGRDWPEHGRIKGGDHGDPDLSHAITAVQRSGRKIPAVVFGHMHHLLHRSRFADPKRSASAGRTPPGETALRRMLVRDADLGIAYINAAVVPRVRGALPRQPQTRTTRHFTVIELTDKEVTRVEDTWLDVGTTVGIANTEVRYESLNRRAIK